MCGEYVYGLSRGLDVGLSLAVAIIIHVIPEGMAIAAPIYHSTGRCVHRTHTTRHDTQG
jgi:zinc transporter ZupT